MSNGELAISCTGLVKRYGEETLAVNGLDLEIRRGECFGLLGPNGAGKTTTVEILEGLLQPTAGKIEILGRYWDRDEQWIRGRIGVTLQQTHLPDRMTVGETINLFRSFFREGRDPDSVMALVSLEEKRDTWYEKLSGGQKQRLAVACALVADPEILFMDEPTTGLDPQSRRQLWGIVENLKREGRTVLLTTHYMDEAERLCDRVAIVDHGKVIAQGTPRDLIAEVVGREIVEFECAGCSGRAEPADGAPNGSKDSVSVFGDSSDCAPAPLPAYGDSAALEASELARLPSVQAVRKIGGGWALTVERVHIAVPALLSYLESNRVPLERLSTHSATLEDVFVTLTGRNLRE